MPMHVRVSGTWQQVLPLGLHARVSGTWRQVQTGWVRVAGTWRQFFQAAVYNLPVGGSDSGFAGSAGMSLQFLSNGTFVVQGDNVGVIESGNWVTPTSLAPGGYTIQLSLLSGTSPSGPALATDHALSSNRTWTLSQVGIGSQSMSVLQTLKDGGGVTVMTRQFDFTVEVFS